jgi:hypothetical protein
VILSGILTVAGLSVVGFPARAQAATGVDLASSVSDSGSPFTAVADVEHGAASSGAWTVTVRNTGTAVATDVTTVTFEVSATGAFRPSSGTGWLCLDLANWRLWGSRIGHPG